MTSTDERINADAQSAAWDNADWALHYASLGYAVFPIFPGTGQGGCACPDRPCLSPGKHPIFADGGHLNASTHERTVQSMWRGRRDRSIGINCGMSGIVVVDVDPKNGGTASLGALQEQHGMLPETLIIDTGGGGKHYLYRTPTGLTISNSAGKLAPGIDIRGDGGYIVAPPSIHASGARYRLTGPLPAVVDLTELPVILAMLAQTPQDSGHKAPAVPEELPEGIRSDQLLSLAGSMRDRGMLPEEIYPSLLKVNSLRGNPPLPDSEVYALAHRVLKWQPEHVPKVLLETGREPVAASERTDTGLIRIYSSEEAQNRPVPPWLIEGVLVASSIAVLAGEQETFKTFVGLSMSLSLAHGLPWYDLPVPAAKAVIYVSGEGTATLARRIAAWEQRHQTGYTPRGQLGLVYHPVQLLDDAEVELLIRSIAAIGMQPSLIVIDTLARAIVGADENSAKDMGRAVAACDRLKHEFDAAIMPIHHLARAGNIRGSTALPAGADTHIATTRDGDVVTLDCAKQKDYDHFAPIYLAKQTVQLPDGTSSLVFEPTTYDAAASEAESVQKTLDALCVQCLVAPDGLTAKEWEAFALAAPHKVSRSVFFTAKARLEQLGTVVCDGDPRKRGVRWRPS